MERRTQKSVKKIKLLLLLMLITTILAITATYAWFSSQREVEISGIKLNVEVAESMQISLDGEHWMQSITIDNMRQFYGTYSDTSTHQANDADNTNYVPTELKPVSTIGEVSSGKLQFMTGEAEMSGTTTSVTAEPCSEADLIKTATVDTREDGNDSHPYLVFDMYLRNYSAKESDNLQLNKESIVWVDNTTASSQEGTGKEGTGLENCIRVGFVVYENTADATASASTVRGLTSSGTSAQVVIWEPNDLEHIQEVIDNSGREVQANTTMPTYGIKYSSSAVTLTDVEDTDTTTNTNIAEQVTMRPAYGITGTTNPTNMTDTSNTAVTLKGNAITKLRVYIWIEGQDVDCINTASQGDRLQANLKLTKPENNEGTENTYDGDGTQNTGVAAGTILTASTLAATPETATTEYGAYVTNYASTSSDAQSSVQWRIFHSDGTNIYLIADDYVPVNYVPTGKDGTAVTPDSTYARAFSLDARADYEGWSDISGTSIATKWLSQYVASGYTSTYNNMKATAYLLDTNQWSAFSNSSYADYAIGGPTLELFTASYNVTHETDIEIQVSSEYGYTAKWSTDMDYSHGVLGLDSKENLYAISSEDNAYGYWLASNVQLTGFLESIEGGHFVYYLFSGGSLSANRCDFENTGVGARPVICLESNIQIEKQEDGTYLIVE